MFFKGKKQNKDNKSTHEFYDVKYENLAVPEVHTEPEAEVHTEPEAEEEMEEEQESITYESVAIPEIHIRKKK